jgi:hypothetical protein
MKNTVLPDLDHDTIERLKERFPDLANMELPKMEDVGKTANETLDRLLGRKKAPMWPWVAGVLGLVALIGVVAAYFTWLRQPILETSETTDVLSPESVFPTAPEVDHTWPTARESDVARGVQEA